MVMPLKIPELQKVSMPRKVAQSMIRLGILGILGLLYFNYAGYSNYTNSVEMIDYKTTQRNALTREHEQETAVFDTLPIPPATVKNVIDIKNMLQANSVDSTPILELLYSTLNANFVIEGMEISHEPDESSSLTSIGNAAATNNGFAGAVQNFLPQTGEEDNSRGTMTVDFVIRTKQSDLPLEEMVILSEGLLESLRQSLPDHEIEIVRQFAGVSRTGAFSVLAGERDNVPAAENQERLTAEFRIEGPPL